MQQLQDWRISTQGPSPNMNFKATGKLEIELCTN